MTLACSEVFRVGHHYTDGIAGFDVSRQLIVAIFLALRSRTDYIAVRGLQAIRVSNVSVNRWNRWPVAP